MSKRRKKTDEFELEIRDYYSGDIPKIWKWRPQDKSEVFFQLDIDIGEKGDEGSYRFECVVATPQGILRAMNEFDLPFPMRGLLVFREYSWRILESYLESVVKHCTRYGWDDSLPCLERYFVWEYEDRHLWNKS